MIFANFKKTHPDAIKPTYSLDGDGCLDLYAVSREEDTNGNIVFNTGIAIEIPSDHVGLLFPRSSVTKTELFLGNSVGVIDSNYRGDIMLKFTKVKSRGMKSYYPGDKIGQLLIVPRPLVTLREVDKLSETNRGSGGFGSTGN